MTKQEIIKLVKEVNADKSTEDMVISYINLSYDSGFNEGMKVATDIQSKTFDMLLGDMHTMNHTKAIELNTSGCIEDIPE